MPATKIIRGRKKRVTKQLASRAFSKRAGKASLATKVQRDATAKKIVSRTNVWAKRTMKGVC